MSQDSTENPCLNIGLPKWPQMLVTGDDVTEDQARDIILRTDRFLTTFSQFAGGNDRIFNENYRRATRLNFFDEEPGQFDRARWALQARAQKELDSILGVVPTEYVRNSWASCAFIYGPHGWCSPKGKITFVDNVGKWPSAEDVLNDWKNLAAAFPYVRARVTLMSGESCEITRPLISFSVAEGTADVCDIDMSVHTGATRGTNSGGLLDVIAHPASLREHGLPSTWMEAYEAQVREAVGEAIRRAESAESAEEP